MGALHARSAIHLRLSGSPWFSVSSVWNLPYGSSTVLPVVLRDSSAMCAAAASFSG